jgi:hypothetical protein
MPSHNGRNEQIFGAIRQIPHGDRRDQWEATARRFPPVDVRRSRQGPILRGLSAAASFHSIRHHVGFPVAVAVAAASAWTDR